MKLIEMQLMVAVIIHKFRCRMIVGAENDESYQRILQKIKRDYEKLEKLMETTMRIPEGASWWEKGANCHSAINEKSLIDSKKFLAGFYQILTNPYKEDAQELSQTLLMRWTETKSIEELIKSGKYGTPKDIFGRIYKEMQHLWENVLPEKIIGGEPNPGFEEKSMKELGQLEKNLEKLGEDMESSLPFL